MIYYTIYPWRSIIYNDNKSLKIITKLSAQELLQGNSREQSGRIEEFLFLLWSDPLVGHLELLHLQKHIVSRCSLPVGKFFCRFFFTCEISWWTKLQKHLKCAAFPILWLNAEAQMTHGGQVQRPREGGSGPRGALRFFIPLFSELSRSCLLYSFLEVNGVSSLWSTDYQTYNDGLTS